MFGLGATAADCDALAWAGFEGVLDRDAPLDGDTDRVSDMVGEMDLLAVFVPMGDFEYDGSPSAYVRTMLGRKEV